MIAAAALALALATAPQGQDHAAPSAVVSGLVVNATTQAPVADALVSIVEANRTTKTGRDGTFTIGNLAPGNYSLSVSSIGFIFVRRDVTVSQDRPLELTIPLAGGTGTYEESVKVSATVLPAAGASVTMLSSAELQGMRTVAADDPLRAVQALPGVVTGNDFRSEFSVRGSAFRQVGVVLDGTATQLLLHTVQAAGDSGSIAMINTDLLAGATLSAGTHPQRHGDWIGATLEFDLREGSRDRTATRAAVSGTNASIVSEGPLGPAKRGSWLASFRKSYIDWLVRQIDPEITGTLGFADAHGKAVYDVSSNQQLQIVVLAGRTTYREPTASRANEIARATSTSILTSAAWRSTYSKLLLTQRLSFVTNQFRDVGANGQQLAVGRTRVWTARSNLTAPLSDVWRVEGGLFASHGTFNETLRNFTRRFGQIFETRARPLGDSSIDGSLWLQVVGQTRGVNVSAGVRATHDTATRSTFGSPWLVLEKSRGRRRFFGGVGGAHQVHSPEVLSLVHGEPAPERAWFADAGMREELNDRIRWTLALFGRRESNVLRRIDEPRRSSVTRAFDAAYPASMATLDGRSRGVDVTIERRAATGVNGWLGYTWAHTRYQDRITREVFDGDFDQRHTLNAFMEQRLSYRLKVTAKLRVGSNMPLVGYFTGARDDLWIGDSRNEVRLPTYARLDLGGSRTFTYRRSRLTLFVEIVNALGRRNLAANDGSIFNDGRAEEFTKRLIPILPSAGLLVEF